MKRLPNFNLVMAWVWAFVALAAILDGDWLFAMLESVLVLLNLELHGLKRGRRGDESR